MGLINPRREPISDHILLTLITYSCTVTGGIHRNKPLAADSISSNQQHFDLLAFYSMVLSAAKTTQ